MAEIWREKNGGTDESIEEFVRDLFSGDLGKNRLQGGPEFLVEERGKSKGTGTNQIGKDCHEVCFFVGPSGEGRVGSRKVQSVRRRSRTEIVPTVEPCAKPLHGRGNWSEGKKFPGLGGEGHN